MLGLVAALAGHVIVSVDLWLHLRTGEWIVEHGRVPHVDIFSFTAAGHKWVDLHWGYQLLVHAVHEAFGAVGIQLVHGAAFLAGTAVVLIEARRRGVPAAALWFAALALLMGHERFLTRPEAFSFLFLALTVRASERIVATGRRPGPGWMVVPVLWANTQGLFVLGPAYLAFRAVGLVLDRALGRSVRGISILAVSALVMLALSVLNPYGLDGTRLPFRLFAQVGGESVYAPVLGELVSPLVGRGTPLLFVVVTALALGGFALYPKRRVSELLPLLAFAALAVSARRNLLLYGLVTMLPTLAALGHGVRSLGARASHAVFVAGSLAIGLAVVSILGGRFYYEVRSPKETGLGFSRSEYPIEATRRLAEISTGGRVFNLLGDGDYLTQRLGSSFSIFMDGRAEVYGEALGRALFAAYVDSTAFSNARARYGFESIVMDTSIPIGRAFVRARTRERDWRLLAYDGRGALLVYAPGAAEGDPVARDVPAPPVGSLDPLPHPRKLSPLSFRTRFPFDDARLGRIHAALDRPVSAAHALSRAVRAFPHNADLYSDLGAALLAVPAPARARDAFRAALILDGAHDAANVGLARAAEALGDRDGALAALVRRTERAPESERAWLELAEMQRRGGETGAAIRTLERAHRRIPAVAPRLAALLWTAGSTDRAVTLIRAHVSEHPSDARARALLARMERSAEDGP